MKKKTQRIVVLILAVVMLLSVLLPALSMLTEASSSTKNKIKDLKSQISGNSAQIKEVEAKLKQARAEKADATTQKKILEEKIGILNEQISSTEAVIAQYAELIAEKEKEIAALEEQEQQQYELFCRQVRDMEEQGSVSYLSILFSASSFTELLDNAMLVSEVMEYHNGVIDSLIATRQDMETVKADLEEARLEEQEIRAEQEANRAELVAQQAEVEKLIAQIREIEANYQDELEKFEQAANELDKRLKDAEAKYKKELEALEAANLNSGDWYWPLPGRYYISSIFANRKNPITGKYGHHTGNDIPAPRGTPVYAAKDGIVTEVAKKEDRVYGYCVSISHGGGYSTFYAHFKSRAVVKEGEKVSKGQVIGYVGSTGWSTGNHLHFELRINGVRKDALSLYPNLESKFTY